jgi:DNA-binding MarR family transcriptional regulator
MEACALATLSTAEPPARRKTSKRASRLRFEVLNAFVDRGMSDLSRAELALWLILYRDTKRCGTARASLSDIARRAGIDRQTASRAVGKLTRRKMLQVLRRGGLNQGPSEYRVFPYQMDK